MAAIHTDECAKYIRSIQEGQAAFDAKYPLHCRECDGVGALPWSDPDVGIFQAFDPCTYCESKQDGEKCALCGQPGDFSERTLDMDENDKRPCGCPTNVYRPDYDGSPCSCYAGVEDLPDTLPTDQDDVPIDEGEDYDFARDDLNYDAWRGLQATRSFRGRD
jgi:hypothetical protein